MNRKRKMDRNARRQQGFSWKNYRHWFRLKKRPAGRFKYS